MRNPFHEYIVDEVVLDAFYREVIKLVAKYGRKIKEIKEFESNFKGLRSFEIPDKIKELLLQDEDLKEAYKNRQNNRIITKRMAKKLFKDCFNEILDETEYVDVTDGQEKPKTKRMVLAEKIINGVMNDTLDAVSLKGFEVIRDTIGEKPTTEIINKGIQAKIIDINASEDKIKQMKQMLDNLKKTTIIDVLEGANGLKQDNTVRRCAEESRDEGNSKASLSCELQRIHNTDVLPDKQD